MSPHSRKCFSDVKPGRHARRPSRAFYLPLLFSILAASLAGCSELNRPEPTPFFAGTNPPPRQEFRWSNGKAPRSLDPATAAAPPDTDVVRALFEGLTELDPRTLEVKPATAERWTPSDSYRSWTFTIRENARWSNGKAVTAHDFVRSWNRLADFGEKLSHRELLANFAGARRVVRAPAEAPQSYTLPVLEEPDGEMSSFVSPSPTPTISPTASPGSPGRPSRTQRGDDFGASATDERTLIVRLKLPDKDFPKLAAHPLFRPVPENFEETGGDRKKNNLITNGPFNLVSSGEDGVIIERSETYWDKAAVKLDRVRFVPTESPERALELYRNGELDAVTNAEFAPLAIKLLEPYQDFRRTKYSGLNYYEINYRTPPFSDRRVREALAIAIERESLTEGELEGTTQPALQFLPFSGKSAGNLVQDKQRAANLLEEAGFPDGQHFPTVRLVINRNDTQQRIARSVARMWKQILNLDTEIIVKDQAELDETRRSLDFDLVRRGVVLPTVNETASLIALFSSPGTLPEMESARRSADAADSAEPAVPPSGSFETIVPSDMILSEEDALFRLYAIPLYFPTSYSLVKPYVVGFETNGLDAPLLTGVEINNDWQPVKPAAESKK